MCYDLDARPPLPPIHGAAGDASRLTLEASDGARISAYSARAERSGGPGIVVMPDVRGLHPFYEELALRFAEAGVHATAMDYFARTAGIEPRGEEFDFMSHVGQTRVETISLDVAATVAHLRSPEGGQADRVYTVGFCFGGRASSLQATQGHDLAGVISFYGVPVGSNRAGLPAPVDVASSFACPVLAIYGGADQAIPPEAIDAFDAALDAAGVERRTIVYPGAPHSFFDRRAEEHADASADAWHQVLEFIGVEAG
jgi:carboxymethylenebutenolidase